MNAEVFKTYHMVYNVNIIFLACGNVFHVLGLCLFPGIFTMLNGKNKLTKDK